MDESESTGSDNMVCGENPTLRLESFEPAAPAAIKAADRRGEGAGVPVDIVADVRPTLALLPCCGRFSELSGGLGSGSGDLWVWQTSPFDKGLANDPGRGTGPNSETSDAIIQCPVRADMLNQRASGRELESQDSHRPI
jgi:hypothetical protein